MAAPQLFIRLWLRAVAQKGQRGALPLGAPMLSVSAIALLQAWHKRRNWVEYLMMLPNVKDFFHSCDFFLPLWLWVCILSSNPLYHIFSLRFFLLIRSHAFPRPTARRSCIDVPCWSVRLEGFVYRDVNGGGSVHGVSRVKRHHCTAWIPWELTFSSAVGFGIRILEVWSPEHNLDIRNPLTPGAMKKIVGWLM